jgi:3-dehydroquinate synthase
MAAVGNTVVDLKDKVDGDSFALKKDATGFDVGYVLPVDNSAHGCSTSGSVTEFDGYLAVDAADRMQYNYNFVSDIFNLENAQLADQYREHGRCLVITDTNLDRLYGERMETYFNHHGIPLSKAVFPINENTKTMRTLESMIDAMQKFGLNRQEPVLVMGGGLITDVGGFAASMLRRNTPYVRVPTSLIGLIDASIAIKVAVNHGDGKNKLGAFHAHQAVYLDTSFLATLPDKEMRVGMAEIIKIATVEEETLFELLEAHCEDLMETKFGWVNPDGKRTADEMSQIKAAGDEVLYRAIHRMLQLETPNLQELNLDRAIAYGHTWSPEVELQAKYTYGKLIMHGHAVAMDMGLSVTLAAQRGLITAEHRDRVHSVISRVGLMLDHPAQWDSDIMASATKEITKTRNGKLRAAVPVGKLGQCNFLNDVTHDELMAAVKGHTALSKGYPREGRGIDFWIENENDAAEDRFVVTPSDLLLNTLGAATRGRTYSEVQEQIDLAAHLVTEAEAMVAKYSTQPSAALQAIAAQTATTNDKWAGLAESGATQMTMEAEMISGQAEAQLLKLLAQFGKVKMALDVGTFTGYSALAMAEALPADGKVVTLEREQSAADMARTHFEASEHAGKIYSHVGDAADELTALADAGEAFDLVFIDADKPGYLNYYSKIMDSGLLKVGGLLVVDNTMYKGEELTGQPLSENAQVVKAVNEAILADDRVEQVMLPLRDGVTLVYRTA